MADQSWGTGSRPEGTGRYPENAKSHQPEGAGRYLSEGAEIQAEIYFSETTETYFPEEAGGRILINFLAIK
jgi:DNA repair photolyase